MDYEDILVVKEGAVATIAVNRPKVMNAIRYKTMLEIQNALDDLAADNSIRVLVLTGTGEKAFVAGGDISSWPSLQAISISFTSFPTDSRSAPTSRTFQNR